MFARIATSLVLTTTACLLNAAPTTVRVQSLADVLIQEKSSTPATVVATNNSQISAEITAQVNTITVQVGDRVAAGDVLIKLDCRSFQNTLIVNRAQRDSLQAQATLAEQQLIRAQTLRKKNNLSKERLDQRIAELAIANANLTAQQAQLADAALAVERCTIKAPYAAAITTRLAGEGTLAAMGSPLLEIIGLNTVELSAQVPSRLADSLTTSATLHFITQQQTQVTTLRALSPVINAAAGSREARLQLSEPLPPGTSGRLEWLSQSQLPSRLLSQRDGQLGVLTASRSKPATAQFIPLDHAREGRNAVIDLPADTRIIIEGRLTLTDGDAITITPPE